MSYRYKGIQAILDIGSNTFVIRFSGSILSYLNEKVKSPIKIAFNLSFLDLSNKPHATYRGYLKLQVVKNSRVVYCV